MRAHTALARRWRGRLVVAFTLGWVPADIESQDDATRVLRTQHCAVSIAAS
jgi:hypothetical protein